MAPLLVAALLVAPAATGYSTTSVMEFASSTAIEYGLNKDHFLGTLNCESAFAYDAQGDDGHSIGVAQIDGDFHPEILRMQMLDPYWSITWMAKEWQKGNANEWTCWRVLYG